MFKKTFICAFVVFLLPLPIPAEQMNGDVNCDESVDILDIVHLIDYKYKEGDAPCPIRYPETPKIVRYENPNAGSIYCESDAWTNIAQITIDVASSGDVYLTANCMIANESFPCMGIGTTPVDGSITYPTLNPWEITPYMSQYGKYMDDVVSVDAGSHTFYYNYRSRWQDEGRSFNFYMVTMTATFFPDNDVME